MRWMRTVATADAGNELSRAYARADLIVSCFNFMNRITQVAASN